MSESQARDRFEVDGRVALITGGGGLMGREHALALLEIGWLTSTRPRWRAWPPTSPRSTAPTG